MKILIVSQHFFPETFRINDIAFELARRGHRVDVLTGRPNYPKGIVYDGYENKPFEIINGVNVFRVNNRPRFQGSVNLFLNYMSFMKKASKKVKTLDNKYDIVFSYQTSPIYQIIPAIKAKKINGCKLVCLCCDQWPESLKARGLSKGPIYKLISQQCKKIYNECDFILNTSPSFIEYNHRINNVPIKKMSYCLQHCEDLFKERCFYKTKREITNLLFAGNIGKVQNVKDIIFAYNELKHSNLYIHIFGDGSCFAECEDLVKKLGLQENVILHGKVDRLSLVDYYKKSDACLLTLSGKSAIGNTIPSKLQEYMSASKPVLAAISGDSRTLIDESNCGKYTDPDDYKKLALLINDFYENKEKYLLLGQNGREFFEKNCTLKAFTDNLERLFISI